MLRIVDDTYKPDPARVRSWPSLDLSSPVLISLSMLMTYGQSTEQIRGLTVQYVCRRRQCSTALQLQFVDIDITVCWLWVTTNSRGLQVGRRDDDAKEETIDRFVAIDLQRMCPKFTCVCIEWILSIVLFSLREHINRSTKHQIGRGLGRLMTMPSQRAYPTADREKLWTIIIKAFRDWVMSANWFASRFVRYFFQTTT
jgi:hypothetical protein